MKPRMTINIGGIEVCETENGNVAITPASAVYDILFNKVTSMSPVIKFMTEIFLVKDEDGVFHKFTGMTYEGTVAPPVSTEQMLKKLIEKFQGALVISTTNTTLVIKEDKLVVAGCGDLLKFIVEFCHHSPYVRQYGFDTFRIIGDQTTAQLRKLSTLEEDWIRNIYKEHS